MKMTQNEKTYLAINSHLILNIAIFLVFLGISISSAMESDTELMIISAVITLLPIGTFLMSPLYFVFSKDAVKIVYCFSFSETIQWRYVRRICREGSWLTKYTTLPCYHFAYPVREKRLFFMNGKIPVTLRTKKLMRMFWKKEID